jgi:hypothetical protein
MMAEFAKEASRRAKEVELQNDHLTQEEFT